jgi:putative phosphoesterase
MIRIGLISDTHGLLRPEAKAFLSGSDVIIHAGDVGHPGILAELQAIAPVTAVRGNNDSGAWAEALNDTELMRVGDCPIYILHDLAQLSIDPSATGIRAVVSGHSHKPRAEQRGSVLFVNPGSAGPRRFTLPISAGEILVRDAKLSARTVELHAPPRTATNLNFTRSSS